MLTTARCAYCGRELNTNEMVKESSYRRGGRAIYICPDCVTVEEGYCRENDTRQGKAKQNGFTESIEVETSASTTKARAELFQLNYIPSSDCTVDCEYKSPIYEGMNALIKAIATIGRLIDEDEISVKDIPSRRIMVGTHMHIGHREYINPETMGYIRRFYHSIYIPLNNAIREDEESACRFFGRFFGEWAVTINENSDAMTHKNFINMEHPYTIEYRIPKFNNAKQYSAVAHFCKDATGIVIENFVKHFNDENIDASRYANMTEYRKHKANVTAKKLVKKYQQYIEKMTW